jgi:hypothetical protein
MARAKPTGRYLLVVVAVCIASWCTTTVASFAGRLTTAPPLRREIPFRPPIPRHGQPFRRGFAARGIQMLPFDSSSIWTAVEVFDGSTIVDPVIVSNVFWASLQAKILTFVLGQVAATLVFCFLLSIASAQISKAADFVSSKIFPDAASSNRNPPNIQVPRELRDKPPTGAARSTIQPDFGKLLICIAIDVIGTSSELVPILGELTDVVSAPIAGLVLRSLFGGSNILFFLEFTEEILPFTDILPLATMCWVIDTFFGDTDLAKLLQLGRYRSATESLVNGSTPNDRSTVIDVESRQVGLRRLTGDKKE